MHKHRETGKVVKVVDMDTSTTYVDEEGHSKTLDTAHFNSLYEETTEKGSFGDDEITVGDLIEQLDQLKQDHAATVEALNNIVKSGEVMMKELGDKLTLAQGEVASRDAVIADKDKTIQVQTDKIAELSKPKK